MGKQGKLKGSQLEDFAPLGKKTPVDELQIIDLKVGDGEAAPEDAVITAHYTGALVKNGIIFQSSHDFGQAISFGLDQVIKGWTVGVPGMRIGGTRRLVIPADMAYGASSPAKNIPANSDLVFDIDLVAIK